MNIQDELMKAMYVKYPSLWALRYKYIKGKPTTFVSKTNPFKNRPWQRQILDDLHPNKVVEKSRQLGISEVNVTECLHFLIYHPKTKVMYTFPTGGQMADFSNTRVTPIFQDSPGLNKYLSKNNNNVSTKKIGESYLFMRSASAGNLGEGADIDMLCLDEFDRMRDGVELAFQEGLKSSPYNLIRRFSTPTVPGRGVDKLYNESDQMRYFHTCSYCGEKQFLEFEENIIQVNPRGVNQTTGEIEDGTFIIACKKCHKELNRWDEGIWVPLKPSIRETRGYLVTQMDASWISADDIMRRQQKYASKQLFYNYVLGKPYVQTGLLVTDADITQSIRLKGHIMSRTRDYIAIVAGIDWGEPSWMVILGIRANGAVDLLHTVCARSSSEMPLSDVTTMCTVLRAYSPNLVVADDGYGADKNQAGYTQFPASWYSCRWTTAINIHSPVRFQSQWNDNLRIVTVDKTVSMQRVLHMIKGHLIGMFPWDEDLKTVCTHLKNVRIMDEEDEGRIYQRVERVGPDHYGCALAYAMIAVNKLTNNGIAFNNRMDFEFI